LHLGGEFKIDGFRKKFSEMEVGITPTKNGRQLCKKLMISD